MITVGKSKVTDKRTGLERASKYSDVPTNALGWVYDLKWLPIPYDLMKLRLRGSERPKSGWWTGIRWSGLRIVKEDQVIAWKRNFDND